MQTERDAQLDRIIKAAETLAKVVEYIEDKSAFMIDGFEPTNKQPTVQETLKDLFDIIKDSGVFNEQRIAMLSLGISIINDFK